MLDVSEVGVLVAGVGLGVGVAEAVVSGAGAAGAGDDSAAEGAGLADSVDGLGSAATFVLFELVLVAFAVFTGLAAAAFGVLLDSVVSVAVEAGAGVAAAGALASATTVDFVSAAVVLVSLVGDEFDDARFDVAAAGTIATGWDATSWLNRNAPAMTSAMITPKAIGKCFTEASCWNRAVPFRQGRPGGVAHGAQESEEGYRPVTMAPTRA